MKKIKYFILLVIVITSCSSTPIPHNSDVIVPNDFFGFVHVVNSYTLEEINHASNLGADWILETFYWSRIEKEKGIFDFSRYDKWVEPAKINGKKVVAVLAYSNDWISNKRYVSNNDIPHYLNFIEATVKHFKGKVDAWQIWNEPNWIFWNGNNKEYFELARQAAAKIREVDPDAYIIGGGLLRTPKNFIRGMHKAGCFENLNALSFHPYAVTPIGSMKLHDDFIKILNELQFKGEIWITEIGYPTGGLYPHSVSMENLPSYVIKTITAASAKGTRTLLWYELYDKYNKGEEKNKAESEYFFGLTYPDFSWKNGAFAYKLCADFLPGSKYMPELPQRNNIPSNIVIFCFVDGKSGLNTLILWNDRNNSFNVKINLPDTFNMYNISTGESVNLPNETVLKVTNTPIFITWQGEKNVKLSRDIK